MGVETKERAMRKREWTIKEMTCWRNKVRRGRVGESREMRKQ